MWIRKNHSKQKVFATCGLIWPLPDDLKSAVGPLSKNGKTNLNLDLKLLQKSTKSIRMVKQNDVVEIFMHDDSKSGPYFEQILFVHLDLAVF